MRRIVLHTSVASTSLSRRPDTTYADTQRQASAHLAMGVRCIWIVDPGTRAACQCSAKGWASTRRLEEHGTRIFLDRDDIFRQLDESLS